MSYVIDVKGLTKSYHTQAGDVLVLRGVDCAIQEGEFVAMMGPSGSGKSTFMNIIGCLDKADTGDYALDGVDVATLDHNGLAHLRNDVLGFVFQGFNLLPRMTLADNVALPLVYAGVGHQARYERARTMLQKVGLKGYENYLPSRISGGQQQRVAIARALINTPRVLLADEPTGNLDTATSYEIMDLFSTLNKEQNLTILLVTHEPDIATYADRTIHFRDGVIEGGHS